MAAVQFFSATDKGLVRNRNEDSVLVFAPEEEGLLEQKGVLAIVADGVGGSTAGSAASSLAVQIVRTSYYGDDGLDPMDALKRAFERAHQTIGAKSRADAAYRGMATTCTAAVVVGNDCYVVHIGDSRAYLLRGGALSRITEDDTLVGKLVREGLISSEEAKTHPQKNVIMRAMGTGDWSEPFMNRLALQEGDRVFLCSDGLHGLVPEEEAAFLLDTLPLPAACERLVDAANKAGGTDNISVAVLFLSPSNEEMEATRQISANLPRAPRSRLRAGIYIVLISAGLLCVAAGALFYVLRTMPSAKPW